MRRRTGINNERGVMLGIVYLVLVVLIVLEAAIVSRGISESRIAQRGRESNLAFGLAEAAVERALYELRTDFSWTTGVTNQALGEGVYTVSVTQIDASKRRIVGTGYLPDATTPRATRQIEAYIRKDAALNSSNAIYVAGELDLRGEAYSITGNVTYATEIEGDTTPNVSGGSQTPNPNQDPTIAPLTALDFQGLRNRAITQGNLWDVNRPQTGFPTQFCYSGSIATNDCVPNVVYVEDDLELNGNIGTISGFFVVVGDVLTNPGGQFDTEINGNGQIAGAIYTTGEFEINGGGGNLNVDGGVWAGTEAELKGNSTVTYNAAYMSVISGFIIPTPQISGWREI